MSKVKEKIERVARKAAVAAVATAMAAGAIIGVGVPIAAKIMEKKDDAKKKETVERKKREIENSAASIQVVGARGVAVSLVPREAMDMEPAEAVEEIEGILGGNKVVADADRAGMAAEIYERVSSAYSGGELKPGERKPLEDFCYKGKGEGYMVRGSVGKDREAAYHVPAWQLGGTAR